MEIEYENQEWMEAVLVCFHGFAVSVSHPYDRMVKLTLKNFIPPKDRTQGRVCFCGCKTFMDILDNM